MKNIAVIPARFGATRFPIIVEGNSLGGYYSFLFYALMMLAHLIFVWKFLPETKGRTLEEIQKDLGIK